MKRRTGALPWAVLVATTVLLGLAGPEARAAHPGANGRIAWSSGRTDELDIWSMTTAGKGRKRLTKALRVEEGAEYSPDGTMIAFYRRTGPGDIYGAAGDIFVMDADGSGLRRLTSGPADDEDPSWSPGGDEIVFSRVTKGNPGDLWVVNASGGGVHRLVHLPGRDIMPSWSSTDVIAFTSFRTGNGDLYSIEPDGTVLTRITKKPTPDLATDWDPDGSRLVFFTDSSKLSERELWWIRGDGTHLTRLTDNDVHDAYPAWAPDGRRIAFQRDVVTNGLDFFDIWTMKPNGTGLKRLTKDGFLDGEPTWQPV